MEVTFTNKEAKETCFKKFNITNDDVLAETTKPSGHVIVDITKNGYDKIKVSNPLYKYIKKRLPDDMDVNDCCEINELSKTATFYHTLEAPSMNDLPKLFGQKRIKPEQILSILPTGETVTALIAYTINLSPILDCQESIINAEFAEIGIVKHP